MTKSEFIEFISHDNPGRYKARRSYMLKHYPEILAEVKAHSDVTGITPVSFNDELNYYIKSVSKQNRCVVCGVPIVLSATYCSRKCMSTDKELVRKRQATLMERNGSTSPLGSPEAKERREATCIKRYGTYHPSKNEEVRERIRSTNVKTYEDESVRKNLSDSLRTMRSERGDDLTEKIKLTNLTQHGEYTTLSSAAIKKIQATNKDRYGTTNPFAIHDDTYDLAAVGSKRFFSNANNVKMTMRKRAKTINVRYGSLGELNRQLFDRKRDERTRKLMDFGLKDKILEYLPGRVKCLCSTCGKEYEASPGFIRDRVSSKLSPCVSCVPLMSMQRSKPEIELYEWLSAYVECEHNDRKILGGKEMDVYVPSCKLGIEFNGAYTHSDRFKPVNYHLIKTDLAESKGVRLQHVWEDVWKTKKDVVKGMILRKLGIYESTINVADCHIEEIKEEDAIEFYHCNCPYEIEHSDKHLRLTHGGDVIACLGYSKEEGKTREVLLFVTKIGVKCDGGFMALFDELKRITNDDIYTMSIDRSWDDGEEPLSAGFDFVGNTDPKCWYVLNDIRYDETSVSTDLLTDSESDVMRVHDCGSSAWKYINRAQSNKDS